MESYTFRCENEDCKELGTAIGGVTMEQVVDAGVPICADCADDLVLVGPDESEKALVARALGPFVAHVNRVLKRTLRGGTPTAYGAVPGEPVNPANVKPLRHVLQYQTCGEGQGGNATCDVCGACYCLPPWTMERIKRDEVCPGVPAASKI